jgi:hypothetical protein
MQQSVKVGRRLGRGTDLKCPTVPADTPTLNICLAASWQTSHAPVSKPRANYGRCSAGKKDRR